MSSSRQLALAASLGAVAGGLVVVDIRVLAAAATGVVALGALCSLWRMGDERIAGMAWAGAAFTAPMNGVRVTSFMAVTDVFLVVAVLAMAPSLALGCRRFSVSAHVGVLAGLAMIATGGVIGTMFAAHPEASLVVIAKFVLAAAGSVAAFALWRPNQRQLSGFCALWLAGALVSSAWALTLDPHRPGRPFGLATHPNHLGLVCVLGTCIALGFVLERHRATRLAGLLSCPVLIAALLASGSRAALVGLLVAGVTVLVLSGRVRLAIRAAMVASTVGVLVLTSALHLSGTGLDRLFGNASASRSDAERVGKLVNSYDRFAAHPLTGEGFEFAQEAHNVYLQVLVAAGPLGLVGLVVVVSFTLSGILRSRRRPGTRATGDRALLAGLGAGSVGYLAAGAFQNILWDRYLWLYVAAAVTLAAQVRPARPWPEAIEFPGPAVSAFPISATDR